MNYPTAVAFGDIIAVADVTMSLPTGNPGGPNDTGVPDMVTAVPEATLVLPIDDRLRDRGWKTTHSDCRRKRLLTLLYSRKRHAAHNARS